MLAQDQGAEHAGMTQARSNGKLDPPRRNARLRTITGNYR
jgi:hypothetical protein